MKGHLQHAVNHFRGQLRQRQNQDRVKIDTLHAVMVAPVQQHLKSLYEQMQAKQQAGEPITLSWLHEGNRLEAVKQDVATQVGHFGAAARMIVEQSIHWAATLGSQAANTFFQAVAQVGESFIAAPFSAVSNVVGGMIGKLGNLFSFGKEAAQEVGDALVRGVSLSNHVKDIADEITQKLDVSRQRAVTISGTLPAQLFKEVNLEEYRANEATIVGWIWVCLLSKNSCIACVAMHGTRHKLSEVFHDHPLGHCSAIPYTQNSTPIQQGANWFAGQSAEVQRAILGSQVAYDLFESGRADVQDFVGFHHDEKWGLGVHQRSAKQVMKGLKGA